MRTEAFKSAYVRAGGTADSANSYVTYLNRVEGLVGELDLEFSRAGSKPLIARVEALPSTSFGGVKQRSDSLSALRKYAELMVR